MNLRTVLHAIILSLQGREEEERNPNVDLNINLNSKSNYDRFGNSCTGSCYEIRLLASVGRSWRKRYTRREEDQEIHQYPRYLL